MGPQMQPKRCLVTGGAGFIGSHLTEALVAQGCFVRVLDNLSTGQPDNLKAVRTQIEWVQGDIRDFDAVQQAMQGIDVVFHHAALASVVQCDENPRLAHDVNVTGTLNLLEAARIEGVQFIFASSAAVYGPAGSSPLVESQPKNPVSVYGLHKALGESYCTLYQQLYGLNTVCFRYFNVYGPRQLANSQYSGVISAFFNSVLQGQSPKLYGDGLQSRDFVSVEDICNINVEVGLSKQSIGGIFNIGTGQEYPIHQILDWLRAHVDPEFMVEHYPERRKDPRHSISDITLASHQLGYQPKVSFQQGLQHLYHSLTTSSLSAVPGG